MNLIIPIGLFFVLLCFFLRNNKGKGEYISFTIAILSIAALLSVRYNYGSDYITYSNLYDLIQYKDISEWEGGKMEILYIQMLEYFPSFEIYIAIQTFLWFGLIWWFYTRYAEKSYLWLAVFFLFFNVAGISTNITALRTNVVSILLIPGFYFLMKNTKRDRLLFAGLVILSSLFHRSSIALLPLALLNAGKVWNLKDKKILLVVILGIGVVSVVFKNVLTIFLANTLIENMSDFFETYSSYLEDYENIKLSGLSTIIYLVQLFVLLNGLTEEKDGKHVVLIKVGVVFVLAELFVAAYLLSRYAAILYPAFVVGFIRSLKYIQKQSAVVAVVLVMLLSGWSFYQTNSARSNVSTKVYHSIFE